MLDGLTLYRGGRALALASEADVRKHINRAAAGDDTIVIADMAPALTDVMHRVIFDRPDVMVLGAIKTEPGSFKSCNELVQLASAKGRSYMLVPTIHRSIMISNTMLLTLQQQHSGHVSDAVIPLDGKAVECVVAGKPVTLYAKGSRASKAVGQLVDEIFGTEV
jgi:cellulose biosynthesis protein BcsQ